ncbi:MAG: hypothetical protein HYU39_05035 [Thaumarchaeota archaeon]|nr:hypothetical protein [Nitrososphaerota archaeon]
MIEETSEPNSVRLEGEVYAGWIGLKNVAITDGREWMSRLRGLNSKVMTQACDARFVAGSKHLEILARQTFEANTRSQLYAERFEVDFLMRTACEKQIKNALSKAGLSSTVRDVAVTGFGSKGDLQSFFKTVSTLWKRDDSVLGLTESKKKFLSRHHKIVKDTLKLGVRDLFPRLLSERAALLQVKG